MNYDEFLAGKAQLADSGGFEPTDLPNHLFDFQRQLVSGSGPSGRGAIFADCGMGKTPMSLAWASRFTGMPETGPIPDTVGGRVQIALGGREVRTRCGTVAVRARWPPITITNYEQLGKPEPAAFGGVV